jgi:hypothetical protein
MTKKDFSLIAMALAHSRPTAVVYPKEYAVRFEVWENVLDEVASTLEDKYENFDRDKFVTAAKHW